MRTEGGQFQKVGTRCDTPPCPTLTLGPGPTHPVEVEATGLQRSLHPLLVC